MKQPPASNSIRAFTLIELMVVVAIVAVLAALVLPALRRAKATSNWAYCNNQLKQIGLAFRTWSQDHGDRFPMLALTNKVGSLESGLATNVFRIFQAMSNDLGNPVILICPSDSRRPARDFSRLGNLNVGYFVGLDADETMPAMILSGDRNLLSNGVAVNPGLLVLTNANSIGFAATIHRGYGNVGLSDGSVQMATSAALKQYVAKSGTNVVRFGIP